MAGVGSASGISGSNLYAPKEFNKENIPEKVNMMLAELNITRLLRLVWFSLDISLTLEQ